MYLYFLKPKYIWRSLVEHYSSIPLSTPQAKQRGEICHFLATKLFEELAYPRHQIQLLKCESRSGQMSLLTMSMGVVLYCSLGPDMHLCGPEICLRGAAERRFIGIRTAEVIVMNHLPTAYLAIRKLTSSFFFLLLLWKTPMVDLVKTWKPREWKWLVCKATRSARHSSMCIVVRTPTSQAMPG